MNFFESVYEAVKKIPRGRVATYGQIALMIGNPRSSRQVGWALHKNPDPASIPCHRVVNRFGELTPAFAFGDGLLEHKRRLMADGVEVDKDYRVDLKKYQWKP